MFQNNQEWIEMSYDTNYRRAQEAMEAMRSSVKTQWSPYPNVNPQLSRSMYSTNISQLKEITVRSMELKVNEGAYIKAKVYKRPFKFPGPSSVRTLLRDKNGDLLMADFYGIAKTDDWSELEKIFRMGREVIILHPLYKQSQVDRFVRVDNRYEFFFSDEISNAKPDFEHLFEASSKLKDEGNQNLKIKNTENALKKYLESIQVLLRSKPRFVLDQEDFVLDWKASFDTIQTKKAKEHLALIFSNLSQVYIIKKQPLYALYYAKFSHWSNPNFFKANLRIIRALIDLLYLYEAQEFLERTKSLEGAQLFQEEIKTLFIDLENLLQEWCSPQKVISFLKNELNFDEGKAYIGPIELYDTAGKGRGYRARRNIPQGEILLIEHGFVIPQQNPQFTYDLLSKLDKTEALKVLYMNLFPCRKSPRPKTLLEDERQKQRIRLVQENFAGFRLEKPKTWENFSETEVQELLSKTDLNSFSVKGNNGVFPHYCLFNHSCDPNISVWYSGNLVMVLARTDIKKGEEIFVSYAALSEGKFKRQLQLIPHGFKCCCSRCSETEEWKHKESKLTGFRCPACHIETACKDEKGFVCPNKCWKAPYDFYQEKCMLITKEINDGMIRKDKEKLIKISERVAKEFAEYNVMQIFPQQALATLYANEKNEEKFKECYSKIVEIAKFYPLMEIIKAINELLTERALNFNKELDTHDIDFLNLYGLKPEVLAGLRLELQQLGKPFSLLTEL